jgi:hypothetical protein
MMSSGMVLLQGDTTQSSTHGTELAEIDSETSNNRSVRKFVG